MLFSSHTFLHLFLPVVVILHWGLPGRGRNALLLCASILFYSAGEGAYTALLVSVSAVAFVTGLILQRIERDTIWHRLVFWLGIVSVLAPLVFYKYFAFVLEQFGISSSKETPWSHLPLGISFFTFQALGYVVDTGRGHIRAERHPGKFLLFISFFPQLIAGPIVRFQRISAALHHRRFSLALFNSGIARFVVGLGRKVLIADPLGRISQSLFAEDAAVLGASFAWLAVVTFAIQLYMDFAGYSDMAVGMGRMCGFHFPENFRSPFHALDVRDFWQRWHITLSHWLRDYLFKPLLRINRTPEMILVWTILTFLVCGIWHGAGWTFVVWGLWNGLFVCLETVRRKKTRHRTFFGTLYVFSVFLVGFVLFRAQSLDQAGTLLTALTGILGVAPANLHQPAYLQPRDWFLIGLALVILITEHKIWPAFWRRHLKRHPATARYSQSAAVILLLWLVLVQLAISRYQPFLYYKF